MYTVHKKSNSLEGRTISGCCGRRAHLPVQQTSRVHATSSAGCMVAGMNASRLMAGTEIDGGLVVANRGGERKRQRLRLATSPRPASAAAPLPKTLSQCKAVRWVVWNQALATALKGLVKERGLRMCDLAVKIQFDPSRVSHWLCGRKTRHAAVGQVLASCTCTDQRIAPL